MMHFRKTSWLWGAAVCAAAGLGGVEQVMAQPLSITPLGRFNFSGGAPEGMSGITYAGDNQYYAVDDSGARMYSLSIDVNLATGAVNSATVGATIQLGGSDLEGVAYNPGSNTVYVSDESGPSIREYNLSGGLVQTISVPSVYTNNLRANKGFESLSLQAGHQSLWTANEEALTVDGNASSTGNDTTVRLQKFDSNLNPAGQWAYKTVKANNDLLDHSSELVGVVDMLALPNGKLLVMERRADVACGGFLCSSPEPRFDNWIFEVDFAGATDVSNIAGLSGASYTPVSKTLLWESPWFDGGARNNFEGMTLGPELDDGDFSILLISDGDEAGGFGVGESLYALHLGGEIPEPTSLAVLGVSVCLVLVRRRRV